MTGMVLVDTNILVYGYDPSDPGKHASAERLLSDLTARGEMFVSTQVLAEFFSVVTRKTRTPLDPPTAARIIRHLSDVTPVLELHASTVLRAVEIGVPAGLAFWDALIWATAREHDIPTVCTEDFSHGRTVDGVTFINPFLALP